MKVGTPGERTCLNCKHAYCEPDDDIVCGLPENGPMGKYIKRQTCGEGLPRFEDHRTAETTDRGRTQNQ